MKAEELYVKELFKRLFGLEFEKIIETNDKTPDFFIKNEGVVIAVAELKSFVFEKFDKDNGWIEKDNGIFEKCSVPLFEKCYF